jgi:broad specificity phosphatase PhoE
MSTTIYLIRHGETVGNAERLIQGQTIGGKLTKHGIKQARALGKWAKTKRIAAVYSSPLSRAVETAKIAFPNHKPILMDDLMEQDAGELSGKTVDEAFKTFHKMAVSKGGKQPERSIDYFLLRYGHEFGGESLADVQERGMKALETIAKANTGKTVAVISHGNLNKSVLCRITGMQPSYGYFCTMLQENACINAIVFDEQGKPSVVAINDTGHLDSVVK